MFVCTCVCVCVCVNSCLCVCVRVCVLCVILLITSRLVLRILRHMELQVKSCTMFVHKVETLARPAPFSLDSEKPLQLKTGRECFNELTWKNGHTWNAALEAPMVRQWQNNERLGKHVPVVMEHVCVCACVLVSVLCVCVWECVCVHVSVSTRTTHTCLPTYGYSISVTTRRSNFTQTHTAHTLRISPQTWACEAQLWALPSQNSASPQHPGLVQTHSYHALTGETRNAAHWTSAKGKQGRNTSLALLPGTV
jgi:hypothetical protein